MINILIIYVDIYLRKYGTYDMQNWYFLCSVLNLPSVTATDIPVSVVVLMQTSLRLWQNQGTVHSLEN